MKDVYVVRDTLGGYAYEHSIGIIPKDLDDKSKGKEYFYMSCKWADRGTSRKENAEKTVEKLRRLNEFAGFEGLDWTIIYVPEQKNLDLDFIKLSKEEQKKQGEHFFLARDIPQGKKTMHKNALKQIRKEFASC